MSGDGLLPGQPGLFPLTPTLGDPEQVPLHRSVSDGKYYYQVNNHIEDTSFLLHNNDNLHKFLQRLRNLFLKPTTNDR